MYLTKAAATPHPVNPDETCVAVTVDPLPNMRPYIFAKALQQASALKDKLLDKPTVLTSGRVTFLLTDISAAKHALEGAGQLRDFAAILPNEI